MLSCEHDFSDYRGLYCTCHMPSTLCSLGDVQSFFIVPDILVKKIMFNPPTNHVRNFDDKHAFTLTVPHFDIHVEKKKNTESLHPQTWNTNKDFNTKTTSLSLSVNLCVYICLCISDENSVFAFFILHLLTAITPLYVL